MSQNPRIKMLKYAPVVALTASLLPSPVSSQGLVTVRDLSYDMALVMATTAIERCRSQGFKSE
jgi:branched-subunit amino acid transport protein